MSLTFWGSGQSWIIWTLLDAIVSPSGDSIYPRYSQEVTWNSHLSVRAKSPLVLSRFNTSWTCFLCLEMSSEYIRMSSRYTITLMSFEGTITGPECGLPFVPGGNSYQMVSVP